MVSASKNQTKETVEENDQDTGFWNCNFPRTDTLFTGDPQKIHIFLQNLRIAFRIYDIRSDDMKLKILMNSLGDSAAEWLESQLERIEGDEEALKLSYELPECKLMVLRKAFHTHQRGSVLEYNRAFDEALEKLKNQQNVEGQWAIELYLGGLKEEVAIAVHQKEPKLLAERWN